jgi:hypothetical protein
MTGFEYDTLFEKARLFIAHGIEARNSGAPVIWQLNAALSLEVLAKAALASVHPVLVADPTSEESLLAACGRQVGTTRKSLGAVATFNRVRKLWPGFTKTHIDFCTAMAARRNAHLHSGELPFADVPDSAWVSVFWDTTKTLLAAQNKTLVDVVDGAEAQRVEALIAERITALEHAIQARVASHRAAFNEKYPARSAQRRALDTQRAQGSLVRPSFADLAPEMIQTEPCPACGYNGATAFERLHDEPTTLPVNADEETGEVDEWRSFLLVHYGAVAFRSSVDSSKAAINRQPDPAIF